jgi:Icc-related predicted phosphoesterase
MAHKTRVYFATDVHGSSKCFRKFLNAGPVYGADVMILGGDVAGKAIQSIVQAPGGKFRCSFIGGDQEVEAGPELEALEKLIADHGYYPYRAEPGELDARKEAGTLDDLFLQLMQERLTGWLTLADERLRPLGKRLMFMLGNDDPPELARLLDAAPWGEHDEGRVLALDDDHEIMSWGFSNKTPWNSYREQDEPEMAASMAKMAARLSHPERAVVNVHAPPFDSQLDDAPVLDENMQVQQVLGQVKMAPVGSTAVRDFLVERQPLLSLHGHIHEASGIRRLGRTIAINPGSDYSTGTLNGALITLEKDKVSAHQLVRG